MPRKPSQKRAQDNYNRKRVRNKIQIDTDEKTVLLFEYFYNKSECESQPDFIRMLLENYSKTL